MSVLYSRQPALVENTVGVDGAAVDCHVELTQLMRELGPISIISVLSLFSFTKLLLIHVSTSRRQSTEV